MKNTMTLVMLATLVSLSAYAHENCDYVSDKSNFEVGQHGALLASYMNYMPVAGSGIGDQAERDDDAFGVCRIMQDGAVITSYGCAGQDHVDKAQMISQKTVMALKALLTNDQLIRSVRAVDAYREDFDYKTRAFASTDQNSYFPVMKKGNLANMIRDLCPLDNEPSRDQLIRK